MNYKIITDEAILKDFIDWLPQCQPHEMYYCCLFARKKYAKDCEFLKGDKSQLKRFTSRKEFLFQKIKQLECEVGSYQEKGNPIPQEALALYISDNPRDLRIATEKSAMELVRIGFSYQNQNPHQIVMSAIQKANGKRHYAHFDFDGVDLDTTLELLEGKLNRTAIVPLMTRGGFHLLIDYSKIDPQYEKRWYSAVMKCPGRDQKGDNIMPVPGTHQGGFTPYLIK